MHTQHWNNYKQSSHLWLPERTRTSFTMASPFEQSLPTSSASHASFLPFTVSMGMSSISMLGSVARQTKGASGLEFVPRPHIQASACHAHSMPATRIGARPV